VLVSCVQEQQHEITRNLAALAQPAEVDAVEHGAPADDEYDPEQGSMDF